MQNLRRDILRVDYRVPLAVYGLGEKRFCTNPKINGRKPFCNPICEPEGHGDKRRGVAFFLLFGDGGDVDMAAGFTFAHPFAVRDRNSGNCAVVQFVDVDLECPSSDARVCRLLECADLLS